MKKSSCFLIIVALLLVSCREEISAPESILFMATAESYDSDATAKTSLDKSGNVLWKKGDQVSIFVGSTLNEQYQVNDDSDGKSSALLNRVSSGSSSGSGIDRNIAFYPYSSSATISKNGSNYVIGGITLPSVQTYAVSSFGNKAFPMAAVTSSVSDYNLKFKNVLGGLKLQLKGTAKITSVSITGNNDEILCGTAKVTYSAAGTPAIERTDATASTVTLDCGDGVQLNMSTATAFIIALPPMTMTKGFTIVAKDTEGKQMEIASSKSQVITRSNLLKMPAVEYVGIKKMQEPTAVDLGLPSGLKWASFNLGASKPEEYGGYYQWAGLEDVTSTSIYLDWSNCPYHTGSNWYTGWAKYVPSNYSSYWSGSGSPDNKTVLDPEDDVAHVMLGCKWRMPTRAEFDELKNNCTSEWTTMNGVTGRKFTSKKNSNSIFLPAAGGRNYVNFYFVGSYGYYWSSSLDYSPYYAYDLYFDSRYVLTYSYENRSNGLSVRPVYQPENYISVSSVSLNRYSLTLKEGEIATLTATVNPSNAANKAVRWYSNDPQIAAINKNTGVITANATGSAIISVYTDNGGKYAACTVKVKAYPVPEAVDLGLPSGLKWASFNLGASVPEEYGGYYQWAGLEDVTSTSIYLDYSNCPYHTGSSSSSGWTKYVPSGESSYWSGPGSPDNKTVLDLEDDVAHVKLGGKWRMPTEAEFDELKNYCTSEWTTLNGVKGSKFTSKTNGNSIFLPAAGFRHDDQLDNVGFLGCYWSSSLSTGTPSGAYEPSFNSVGVGAFSGGRYYGHSVRPVSE